MSESCNSAEHPESVNQNRLALAALAACFVKTFNETDPSFAARFEVHLRESHDHFKDPDHLNEGVMETLKWTHQIMQW